MDLGQCRFEPTCTKLALTCPVLANNLALFNQHITYVRIFEEGEIP